MDLLLNSTKDWAGAPTPRKVIEEEVTEIFILKISFRWSCFGCSRIQKNKTNENEMKTY